MSKKVPIPTFVYAANDRSSRPADRRRPLIITFSTSSRKFSCVNFACMILMIEMGTDFTVAPASWEKLEIVPSES